MAMARHMEGYPKSKATLAAAKKWNKKNSRCPDFGEESEGGVDKALFKEALELNLMDLSVEDMKEHGRLLLLKQKLVSLVDAE